MLESPEPITREVLALGPPDALPRWVFLRLAELVYRRGRDREGERTYAASLSPGLRMLWGTSLLENEVFNGGFDRYFFNSSRCYTAEALDGLALLAAGQHELLLREAIDAVRSAVGGDLAFDDPCWRERFAAAEAPTLEPLTRRYWELPLLEALQAAYIQEHPLQFLTD